MTRIRILTYNIHKGFDTGNFRFVLDDIRKNLRQVDANLVFLQEIHGEKAITRQRFDHWPTNNQFEFLADEVWDHFAYGKNAIYKSGHHGNAILSKYPFVEWENIDVSTMATASRSLLHGILQVPDTGQVIHAICVHLGLFEKEREQQLKTLVRRISFHVPPEQPLIIAGDFNDWRGKAEQHFHAELNLREAYRELRGHHARTFPALFPMLKMDRVYYRGLELLSANRLHGNEWRSLSDHTPLLVEFSL